jgi:predicted DNA-binding transcriptional regulator AlpA
MQTDDFLDTAGASAFLKLSPSTLTKRRLTGDGPKYLKLGRRVVYSRRELEAWTRAHERGSTSNTIRSARHEGCLQFA